MEESNTYDHLIGQALDEYVIESLIDRGGHAAVFLARNITLQTKVALKVLGMPGFLSAQVNLDSALSEARHQAKINHQAIVRIYQPGIASLDFEGETVRVLYIPMEYAEKGNCKENPPFVRRELTKHDISSIHNLIDGLRMVHERGLVHNDIKPANILRFDDYSNGATRTVLRITDFGIARDPSLIGLQQGEPGGLTPEYMSPEQLTFQVSSRNDVYSMGATLYYLLTGIDPIPAPENVEDLLAWQNQHLTLPRPNAWLANAGCPPRLALLIMRMMTVAPENRPELIECLEALRDINDFFDKKVFGFSLPPELEEQLERDVFPLRYTPNFRKIYKPAVHELCHTKPYVISIQMAHPVFSQYKRLIRHLIRKFSDCFSLYETYGTYDIQVFLWSDDERVLHFKKELELEFAGSSVRMGPATNVLHIHDKMQDYPEGANPVGALAIQLGIDMPDLDPRTYVCDSFPEGIPEHAVRAFTFVDAIQQPTTEFTRTAIVDRVRQRMMQLTQEILSAADARVLSTSESTTLSFSQVRAAPPGGRSSSDTSDRAMDSPIRHRFPRMTMVELSTQFNPTVVLVNFVARQYKDVHAVATAIMDLGEYAVKTATYLETGRIIIQSDKVLF
jgi:serine/threonine protein kinase